MSQSITLEEALEQLQALEAQIKQLQAAAAEAETRLAQLMSLEEALASLRGGSEDALLPLDPVATVLVRGSIKPLDRVIVHAGLNVFVELPHEKAVEHVREQRAAVSKLLDTYNRELGKLTQYYTALRAAVERSLAAAEAAAVQRQGGRGQRQQ